MVGTLLLTSAIYWPGLSGGWLFDDYPNIVDNPGVHPDKLSMSALVRAALSSPASFLKRPLASLSFAANYLLTGLDPFWMKLTNLGIHLLNGWLVFLLGRRLLQLAAPPDADEHKGDICALLIATAWLLLPINITAVLYVVQRMESLANVLVLTGLIGYVDGRQRMLASPTVQPRGSHWRRGSVLDRGFILCICSITVPTALGVLVKETAVMLPLYAMLIEWAVFRFRSAATTDARDGLSTTTQIEQPILLRASDNSKLATARKDRRPVRLFLVVLALPMAIGSFWLLPSLIAPGKWATRDFTLGTRLLSEARIVVDYIGWTLLPHPQALSFYHDDFMVSSGLLSPWTTLASILVLTGMVVLAWMLRPRHPLAALGISLFLGCHLLTGTILPLELIYEHRNYFASFGLLLSIVPPLTFAATPVRTFALPRWTLFVCLLLWWTTVTAVTVRAWGNPLRLSEALAERAPNSPRALYELGRTYIIYSHYDPTSPFTKLAYAPLERAAALPESSILPQQALIFMNARMNLPIKDIWWDSMIAKLKAHPPGVQDESSLAALARCAEDRSCVLPANRMVQAFEASLTHPHSDARLYASYADYAWNVLENHVLGERMTEAAVKASPNEPAYQITLMRRLLVLGRQEEARQVLERVEKLNIGGRLDDSLAGLRTSLAQP
jgi:hypothetical protein